jgi:hypothetical protein
MIDMTNATAMSGDSDGLETKNQNCVPMGPRIPTIEEIAGMLDEAGIDYTPLPDEERLYVTAFSFNIWIRVHAKSAGVILNTNWDLCAEADELEVLQTVNQLNCTFTQVQFAWDDENNRLNGHAWISARGGLSRAVLIRTAMRFADIFKEALDLTHSAGLIKDDDEPAAIH